MPDSKHVSPKLKLKMNNELKDDLLPSARHSSNEMLVACAGELQKCYIAGKISGLPMSEYKANFEMAKKEVKAMGFEPVCPIDLPHIHGKSWQEYMRECLTEMLKCDKIYALTNWKMSKGAKIEIALAEELGIKIINQREMVKIKISIANDNGWWDDDLSADIVLPSVPNVNDTVHLTRDVLDGLEYRYTKLDERRKKQYERWSYGGMIGFDDAVCVCAIRYSNDSDCVYVCLDDTPFENK